MGKEERKEMSYIMIIAEKPQASERIAKSLSEGKAKKVGRGGAYYFEFTLNGKKHVCVPAVGHLFSLNTKNNGDGWNYPNFSCDWIPTYTKKDLRWTKKYFKNIKELAKNADEFVGATDMDREGEVLLYNILRFICKVKDAKRMKFSTLTKSELKESYKKMSSHILFPILESGLTRHFLDFYWGINLTRALTIAMKKNMNGFKLVSSGRVQSPTLHMLAEREIEIKKFIPTPYWQLELHCLADGDELIANYKEDKIWEKPKAQKIFGECKDQDAKVKDINKRRYKQRPPVPFNTSSLQSVAYTHFKFSPKQTMSIAEALYNAGLISYPRTSSQKLPKKIGYKKILTKLSKNSLYEKDCKKLLGQGSLTPNEGKKKDPAHPAIFPTGEFSGKLTGQQRRLYDLCVRRFLAVFGPDAIRESTRVVLDVDGHNYLLSGKRTVKPGWIEFYGKYVRYKEQILPELNKGKVLPVKELLMLDKETQPPNRYSQGSIIKEMEKKGLGTKATRANIVQTLYDRGYIKGKQVEVTEFGEKVAEVLENNCPKIVSEELTSKFEEEMEQVREGKKKRGEVVQEAKDLLIGILKEFKEKEDKIGEELSKAYISFKRNKKTIGECPKCGNNLKIIRSKKTGKRFIGCDNFPDCDRSYPLPQSGGITVLKKKCSECGLPMIRVNRGKKSYSMCIDHNCKSKEDWGKKKKSKKK